MLTKKLQGINFNKFLCLIGTGITIKHSSIHAKKKAILWNSKSLSKVNGVTPATGDDDSL